MFLFDRSNTGINYWDNNNNALLLTLQQPEPVKLMKARPGAVAVDDHPVIMQVNLPPSLHGEIATWANPADTPGEWTVVSASRFMLTGHTRPRAESEQAYLRARKLRVKAALREPYFSLVEANRHLLKSQTMLHLVAVLSYLQHDDLNAAHDARPWALIHPQAKEGVPMLSATGVYSVRLFWMGHWRKVSVDALLPCHKSGACLVVQSPIPRELWPAIICKAILTLVQLTYETAYEVPEYGEADVLQMLTGWQPVTYTTQPQLAEQEAVLGILEELHSLYTPAVAYEADEPPPAEVRVDSVSLPGAQQESALDSHAAKKGRNAQRPDPTRPADPRAATSDAHETGDG